MDHLGDLRQAAMAAAQLAIRSQGARNQQHDARADALATGTEQMLGGGLQDRVPSPDQAAQIAQQGLEVGLDRLKQLCDGGHVPLR